MRPIRRSKLRLRLGSYYYKFRRYAEWYLGNTSFARQAQDKLLPYPVIKHQTPLLRKLKGGATCAYNYLDLRMYNPTDRPYQLVISIDSEYLTGEWRTTAAPMLTYEVYEKEHRMTQEHWGGYSRHNSIYRRTYRLDGELAADEFITDNHALMMYQPFLEPGNSTTSETGE